MADYKPNVKCDSTSTPGPPWNSSAAIFTNMRTSKQFRVFGRFEEANVEEVVPLVLEARKTSIAPVMNPEVKGTA